MFSSHIQLRSGFDSRLFLKSRLSRKVKLFSRKGPHNRFPCTYVLWHQSHQVVFSYSDLIAARCSVPGRNSDSRVLAFMYANRITKTVSRCLVHAHARSKHNLQHRCSMHTLVWWADPESVHRNPLRYVYYQCRRHQNRKKRKKSSLEMEEHVVAHHTCHKPMNASNRNTHISCVQLPNTVTREILHRVHEHSEHPQTDGHRVERWLFSI